jgi:1-acyl-sn-glycerol-3-phosphate acyltransferase
MIPARLSRTMLPFVDAYVGLYLRRRFHAVRLWGSEGAVEIPRDMPLLLLANHASWWDVLVGYFLGRRLVRLPCYAPMDEVQLRRYRILTRIGVYSIDRASRLGIRSFLRYTVDLLEAGCAVWMTPQGEICSGWRRPVRFQTGVGHLVRRLPALAVVPVAIVYDFLDEPRPEIFVKFGPPRIFRGGRDDSATITRRLERDLELELDTIQAALIERDVRPFSILLEGATSMSVVYDRVRAVRAWLGGRPDPVRHGEVVSDPRKERRP